MSRKPGTREKKRAKRHRRIRATVEGTLERPRLSIYRSNKYMYAQLIDDIGGETLASSNSRDLGVDEGMLDQARAVGEDIAKKAQKNDITKAVFDRSGYQYTGRVKALADAARDAGLEF